MEIRADLPDMYLTSHPYRSARFAFLALCAFLVACGGESTGPAERRVSLAAGAGDGQFGSPGQLLADSLAVIVTDASTGRAVDKATVRWRVASGGGTLTATSSTTDARGIARALLRLGPDTGTVRIEADADARNGNPATFTVRAVRTPAISAVTPLPVPAGGTVTIEGQNFSTRPEDHTVLFGGRRGTVSAATPTRLTVQVPGCLPSRSLAVEVRLGAVASNDVNVAVNGAAPAPLGLARGQFRLLDRAEDLACVAFQLSSGDAYLLLGINAARSQGIPMPWTLTGLAGAPIAIPDALTPSGTPDPSLAWEMNVRALERAIGPGPAPAALGPQTGAQAVMPEIGERKQFNVLNRQNTTDRITAEIKAISTRAIVYVDLEAPSPGFSQADLDAFGRLFDDPIFPTTVQVFGSPTDIDANGRVIILLTPRVNALTSRGENSFIAGFFYGCDLVDAQRCKDTNRGEVFYSLVPDPDGRFSSPRTRETILRTVPGVLAHEFQHMISFGKKGRLDLLWLSEGLAHMAEERVGRVFGERGDPVNEADFRRPNHVRARSYLNVPAAISMVDEVSPGTLELRGVAWLFVQYLYMQYGGDALLGRLGGSAALGADNVQAEVGRPWETVFGEFSAALWATGAPELAGATVDPRLTFGAYDLRGVISSGGVYPLRPTAITFADINRSGALPPAATAYFLASASGTLAAPYTLSFAGRWGGPFERGSPRLGVLRVR